MILWLKRVIDDNSLSSVKLHISHLINFMEVPKCIVYTNSLYTQMYTLKEFVIKNVFQV